MDTIDKIRLKFLLLEIKLLSYSFESILPTWTTVLLFALVSKEKIINIISVMNKTTCASNPFPSKLLMTDVPTVIDITCILNIVF